MTSKVCSCSGLTFADIKSLNVIETFSYEMLFDLFRKNTQCMW